MGAPEVIILLFFAVIFLGIPAAILYWIIRSAVRAGTRDGNRDRKR